ncbi:MAG: hypothetical protein EOS04_24520 [Mesorhizobium sp.]|nr:MAG: hypothetical protein EOR98_26860 [Mesorhizobium sp.]RWN73139.1 MAG: hypothetical protein EOS01_26690 [Mesorhizobium sp.]RWN85205.1 MAG: hypothetical protein EOS04_24520 [Mesorhizobium sp.]
MAEWRLKRGMPEWHQVMLFRDTLRDGTVIEAYTEDCDGDVEYWGVKENGVLVASGQTDCSQDLARLAAEQVICYGAAVGSIA